MNSYDTPASLQSASGLERPSPTLIEGTVFDSLRATVEREVTPSAIIAITSPLSEDGREVASRGLASSLAATGYATLLIDTSIGSRSLSTPEAGLSLDDIARQLTSPDPAANLALLTLSDGKLQRATSQRRVLSAFEIFRRTFDYIIISTGYGAWDSFATSVLNGADAILVSVKVGRRVQRDDSALSRRLENSGSRFLGVVALESATLNDPASIAAVSYAVPTVRRSSQNNGDTDLRRREVSTWPK